MVDDEESTVFEGSGGLRVRAFLGYRGRVGPGISIGCVGGRDIVSNYLVEIEAC